jgi:hypothetical protein
MAAAFDEIGVEAGSRVPLVGAAAWGRAAPAALDRYAEAAAARRVSAVMVREPAASSKASSRAAASQPGWRRWRAGR